MIRDNRVDEARVCEAVFAVTPVCFIFMAAAAVATNTHCGRTLAVVSAV
jgi:hypothetical protein